MKNSIISISRLDALMEFIIDDLWEYIVVDLGSGRATSGFSEHTSAVNHGNKVRETDTAQSRRSVRRRGVQKPMYNIQKVKEHFLLAVVWFMRFLLMDSKVQCEESEYFLEDLQCMRTNHSSGSADLRQVLENNVLLGNERRSYAMSFGNPANFHLYLEHNNDRFGEHICA